MTVEIFFIIMMAVSAGFLIGCFWVACRDLVPAEAQRERDLHHLKAIAARQRSFWDGR